MEIHESSEDYLEAILMIKEAQGYVRSVDIADHLEVSKPSVTYATKKLKDAHLISMDHNGMITLTDKGMKIAKDIYNRHNTLICFFMYLGVSREQAIIDACKVEHDISKETFNSIKNKLLENGIGVD